MFHDAYNDLIIPDYLKTTSDFNMIEYAKTPEGQAAAKAVTAEPPDMLYRINTESAPTFIGPAVQSNPPISTQISTYEQPSIVTPIKSLSLPSSMTSLPSSMTMRPASKPFDLKLIGLGMMAIAGIIMIMDKPRNKK